jgi:outer membrane protein TolC
MRTKLWFLAAGALSAGACAEGVTLKALEQHIAAAPAVRLAEAERDVAESRHAVALAAAAPRLFASGSVGRFEDPTRPEQYLVQSFRPDGAIDEYYQRLTPQDGRHTRYGAVVGVRLPLFGSREVVLRDIDSAKGNVATQRLREKVARMEALKALRYAYVDAYYRQAQARLAHAYLAGEQQASRVLLLRSAANVLLAADRKAIETTFLAARHGAIETAAAGADALERVQILSGRQLAGAGLEPPAFSIACVSRARVEQGIASHPDILFHAAELAHKRRLMAGAGAGLTEGGISLSHGRARESGGGHGHSTALSVDISIPLFAAAWRRAQRGQALAEVSKAELLLDNRRQEYLASIGKSFGELEARDQQVRLVRQRLDTALEAHRVAGLRTAMLDDDLITGWLRAKFDVYAAANAHLEAEIARARAQIDMLGYGIDCPLLPPVGDDINAVVDPILGAALPGLHNPDTRPLAERPDEQVTGWYAWKGFARFEALGPAQFWSTLHGATRILLSLDAAEIHGVLNDERRATGLRALLDSAAGRGVQVELLLGDPHWALAAPRQRLIRLVAALAHFPFAGLHLDFERMQLDADGRKAWPAGLVDTVAELKSRSALPVAVSLHPRDAAVPGLLQGLQEAGLSEVTFMAYITDPKRVAAMLQPVLRRHPPLRFSVAQSIEPRLPKEHSYAHLPRGARANAWRELAAQLRSAPNFSGIIIQSLEDHLPGAENED